MKIKKILIILGITLTAFSISGCNKKEENPSNLPEEKSEEYKKVYDDEYEVLTEKGELVSHDLVYSDSYFLTNDYNIDLAKASFALTYASDYIDSSKEANANFIDIMTKMGYSNFYANEYLYEETDVFGIGVQISSKQTRLDGEDKTIVAASIRGFDYGYEWTSNFYIGQSGDHEGFKIASKVVIHELDNYIENLDNKNIILWLGGYSRGGAVANMTAAYLDNYINYKKNGSWLIDEVEPSISFDLDFEDLYCYTFEAARGAYNSNIEAMKDVTTNIHNFVNESDLVPMLVPEKLGFGHYGRTQNYLIDPENEKYKDIGKYYGLDYQVVIDEYAAALFRKNEDDIELDLGGFKLYVYKLDSKTTVRDFYLDLANDLVEIFGTRERYHEVVDEIIKELIVVYRNLSKEERQKVIDAFLEGMKSLNFFSYLKSSGVKTLINDSFKAVNVTIKNSVYDAIDSVYNILIDVIFDLDLSSDGSLKKAATLYANLEMLIINHSPSFTAEIIDRL